MTFTPSRAAAAFKVRWRWLAHDAHGLQLERSQAGRPNDILFRAMLRRLRHPNSSPFRKTRCRTCR
jgi:hypothetical protein